MKIILCDKCKKNKAIEEYKIKRHRRGCYINGRWSDNLWNGWKKIDICQQCLDKLFEKNINERKNQYEKV